jgi:hypothetical protein
MDGQAEALEDLYLAEQHGMNPGAVRDERAAIFEAVGRYDEALALRREAVKRASTFQSVAALASSYAAQRECDYAERLFEDSRRRIRDGVDELTALASLVFPYLGPAHVPGKPLPTKKTGNEGDFPCQQE